MHDGPRLTRRSVGGALYKARDLAELVGHDGREPRALRLPRRDELAERDAKPLEQRLFELRMRLLALLPFHHLDHTPHAKQRIEAWSGKLRQPLRALGRGERLAQRSLVEADGELSGFPAKRQVEGAIPSPQHFLGEQIARLMESSSGLDPERLHQEALLLAAKADIQEELDRLRSHVTAAQDLLTQDQPVGRRLEFLAQEFNREANTICSKASDIEISRTGLELKTVIDQLREQVQNIE